MITPVRTSLLLAVILAACADLEVAEQAAPIVGGERTADYPAVPFLRITTAGGGGGCSGTLVSPRVVLTAAHCVDPASVGGTVTRLSAYFGTSVTGSDPGFIEEIPAEDWIYVDGWSFDGGDFAVVLLEHDAVTAPMELNTAPLGAGQVGRPLHLVGWGNVQEGSGAGTKRHVTADIGSVSDWLVEYGSPDANTCQGDSGGPGFLQIDGREVIASVTSWGVEGCLSDSGAGRVDRAADWVADFIADRDVPIPPEVSFVSPAPGAVVRPGFPVQVNASDNTRVDRLELWLDGAMAASIPTDAPPYIVNTPVVDDGPVTVEVRAFDNRGDRADATLEVTVDSACQTAEDCGDDYDCEDGTCVPHGATGDTCEANEDCLNGTCGTIGEESYCTEACTGSDSCPAGTECIEDGYCWPAEEEGGCSVGGSGAGPTAAPLWLLALLLVVMRRRRE